MGDKTKIEWAHASWNPIRGCSKVSTGCENCYAARMASRFSGPGNPYHGLARHGEWTGPPRLIANDVDRPLRWKRPRRIFVCSMSDLFHEGVTDDWLDRVWSVMGRASQHTFIVLTKRPKRMREYLRDCEPMEHVWLGVSAENQEAADDRIPILLHTSAAVRWVSVEPMLGPINMAIAMGAHPLDARIDWVVCGGESGPGARPMHVAWARSLRDQCIAEGVPFFLKQMDAVKMPSLDGKVWDEVPL